MQTQYIPRGSDLVASAFRARGSECGGLRGPSSSFSLDEFRRLDREIAILHRQIALSSLFSWNLESWAPGRNRVLVAPDPVERKRSRWELAVALVLACLALCACEPDDSKPREPEVSDPFRPPPELRPQLRGLHVYQVKDGQGVGKEVVVIIQKGAGT